MIIVVIPVSSWQKSLLIHPMKLKKEENIRKK
jgi:hypothetical protein